MGEEITDTTGFELIPEGTYTLTVNGVPEKRRTSSGKSTYRIWKFKTQVGAAMKVIRILMFPQDSYDLLIALGGEDVGSRQVKWNDEAVDGKQVSADIVHVEGTDGKKREKLENVSMEAWDE